MLHVGKYLHWTNMQKFCLCFQHAKHDQTLYLIWHAANFYKEDFSVKFTLKLQLFTATCSSIWRTEHLIQKPKVVDSCPTSSKFLVHLSWAEGSGALLWSCVVRRPSLTFNIFDFSSETAKRNSTKLDRKQDLNVLYKVCVFRADRKNKMATLASDWLRHFRLLLWNRWTEFDETWQEERSQGPLPSLCFSGWSEKQDGRPGLWLAETFSTSPLKPLNVIQRNLTESKISRSSIKFVFFGPIRKTRWPPCPLIGWDIFDFSSETAERNSTKLDMKQDLKVLYQVCVFRADRKNKMAALASDWLRHFRLLLWNR